MNFTNHFKLIEERRNFLKFKNNLRCFIRIQTNEKFNLELLQPLSELHNNLNPTSQFPALRDFNYFPTFFLNDCKKSSPFLLFIVYSVISRIHFTDSFFVS